MISRLFGKSMEEIMDELDLPGTIIEAPNRISDVLCTRDSYFHSCWLRMKQMHPDRIQEMGEMELYIAGLDTSTEEETEEEDEREHATII